MSLTLPLTNWSSKDVEDRLALEARVTDAATELAYLQKELQRRKWLNDPVSWMRERLHEEPWSRQREIFNSVRDNRKTVVASAHEIGKSFLAARVTGWWIDCHPPGTAFVVTSAPSANQVRNILWREIGRMHAQAGLAGRLNTTEWKMPILAPTRYSLDNVGGPGLGTREEVVAFGRKPDDYEPTAFQGIHAMYVLLILDECCGIPPALWEAGDSLIANDNSKALAIGNPDDPHSEFAKNCAPGGGWKFISISAFDSPNFTGEAVAPNVAAQLIGRRYVEEKRKRWAPSWLWSPDGSKVVPPPGISLDKAIQSTNPLWQSKVLGKFPHVSSIGGLIPMSWIQRAQKYEAKIIAGDENILGVDVGTGGDSTCIAQRRGDRVRILHEDSNPNTMETLGNVVRFMQETGAERANIDSIGVGKGVLDRGLELNQPFLGIDSGGEMADSDHYSNRRSELWWRVRERFEKGEIDIDPEDEDLAAELVSIHYVRLSAGKIQIESKREAKRRGIPSPNRADSLMLTFADVVDDEKIKGYGKALW